MPVLLMVGGVLRLATNFLKKYWKVALVVIAVIVLFYMHQGYVHRYGEAQFKRGVDATLSKVKTEVSKKNEVNRAIETKTDNGIKNFANDKAKQDAERHAREQKSASKIAVSIDSVPMWKSQECAITSQVLAERNAIRELGPSIKGDTK